jgi:hypothetical protein
VIRAGAAEMAVEVVAGGEVVEPTAVDRLTSARTPQERASLLGDMLITPREVRLFACACCRGERAEFPADATRLAERRLDGSAGGWPASLDAVLRRVAVSRVGDVAERYADGLATAEELDPARHRLGQVNQAPGMADVACARDPMSFVSAHELRTGRDESGEANAPQATHEGRPALPWRDEYVLVLEDMARPRPFASVAA